MKRPEMLMPDELDEGQARGEVARAGDNPNVRTSDNQKTPFDGLGVSRQPA